MGTENEFVLDIDNELIRAVYDACDNYEEVKFASESKRCLIFCSANSLYFPEVYSKFRWMVEGNHYEGKNICQSNKIRSYYGKVIFIRDIYKAWYVVGINKRINSIDALCELCRNLTEGWEVTTAGGSAGGYIATIIGIRLNAARVYNFAGQSSLFLGDCLKHPMLRRFMDCDEKRKYYDIVDITCCQTQILYFYSAKCQEDIEQVKHLQSKRKENITYFPMRSDTHGESLAGGCMIYLLCMETERVKQYTRLARGGDILRGRLFILAAGLPQYLYCMCRKWVYAWKEKFYPLKERIFKRS